MSEEEKEIYIEGLKRQVRYRCSNIDMVDELCRKLDVAKKEADVFEKLFNLNQQSFLQFYQVFLKAF